MAVKVWDNHGKTQEYANGNHIAVVEGHLHVKTYSQGDTVAIFAPGKWVRTEQYSTGK